MSDKQDVALAFLRAEVAVLRERNEALERAIRLRDEQLAALQERVTRLQKAVAVES